MTDLPARLARFCTGARAAGVAGPGPLLVAVSGGPDSLALLDLLRRAAPDWGLALHVAHLDHGWRGAAGAADAAFVAATCAAWGIPCVVRHCDVPAYARAEHLSPEDAARRVRYAFLAAAATAVGATAVAAGHTASDQVETVAGHWLRGAGAAGLAGMAPWSPLPLPPDAAELAAALDLPAPAAPLWLLRPLLDAWRPEILAYCAAHDLQPREDATNADPTYRRNYLRHHLLPDLERLQPGLARRLWESAAVWRDEDALLEADLDAAWPDLAQEAPGTVTLDLAAWAALPPALQRRALRRAATVAAGGAVEIGAAHVRAARDLLGPEANTGARIDWPGALQVRRERDRAVVARGTAPLEPAWPVLPPGTEQPVPETGAVPLDGFTLVVAEPPAAPPAVPGPPDAWTAWFDAEALAAGGLLPLVLRTRRAGERLRPFGAGGHSRKLQDVLVDGGIPRAIRDSLALLAGADGTLLWVPGPGGRRSVHAPVGPATRRMRAFAFARQATGNPAP